MSNIQPAKIYKTLVHHEVRKDLTNVSVPHICSVLYVSHLCIHGWYLEVLVPYYLIQTSGWSVIDHPYVIKNFYQENVCEAENFFSAADIILTPHLRYLLISFISGYMFLGSFM